MESKTAKNLVFSLVLLGLSLSLTLGTIKIAQRGSRLIEARNELAALEKEKEQLKERAEYVKSNEFVEEEARNKLNMIKPGEEVYLRPKIFGDDLFDFEQKDDLNSKDKAGKGAKTQENKNSGSLSNVAGVSTSFDSSGSSNEFTDKFSDKPRSVFTWLLDKIRGILLL